MLNTNRSATSSMIFVGTHHKTGSVLFGNVFRHISNALGLTFFSGWQEQLDPETNVWFMEHSRIDPNRLGDFRGVHIIRHPLNVVYSGYKYHKVCTETWCVDRGAPTAADRIRYDFDGLSYQEKLKTLNTPEGLLFEMQGRSYNAIMDMYRWDYADGRFLTVKYEDIVGSYDDSFGRILAFLGLPVRKGLRIAARHDINRLTESQVGKLTHVTDKTRSFDHRAQFSPELLQAFDAIYPKDLLGCLGYPAHS